MVITLPREPVGSSGIFPIDVAGAISGLRYDTITSIKWDVRPSMGVVAKDVQRLGLDIRSFREPLTAIVKTVLIPSIRKNFDAGGRPAWEPLAEATILARKYSAWPILQRSGKLRKRATQLNIWDIGLTTATIRSLPSDVFYGAYHQAGASGGSGSSSLSGFMPGSKEAEALIARFLPKAAKELGAKASPKHVRARALGMLLDTSEGWSLPARPFIMYQPEDVPKMDKIFLDWMTMRAIRSGRFIGG
jgi:phage gpG-like protein